MILITARSDDFWCLEEFFVPETWVKQKKNSPDSALGPWPVGKQTVKSVMNNKMLCKYVLYSIQNFAFSAELVCVYLVFKLEG